MKIINNENIITNKQIESILQILGKEYRPRSLVVYETRLDIIKFFPICFNFSLDEFGGELEGVYDESTDAVYIFVFVQTDDGDDVHSKQLYSLHALLHELRHRFQLATKFLTRDDEKSEKDADQFATNFINSNSRKISQIMHWDEEWTVKEEE